MKTRVTCRVTDKIVTDLFTVKTILVYHGKKLVRSIEVLAQI